MIFPNRLLSYDLSVCFDRPNREFLTARGCERLSMGVLRLCALEIIYYTGVCIRLYITNGEMELCGAVKHRRCTCDMSECGASDETRRRQNIDDEQRQDEKQALPHDSILVRRRYEHHHQNVSLSRHATTSPSSSVQL